MTKKRYPQGKKVRISGITEKLIIAGLILCCVVVLIFSIFAVLKSVGKNSLKQHAGAIANQELSTNLSEKNEITDEPLELEEGQILVEGEIYEYNDDIMTFLCIGVDSRNGIEKEKTPGKAGQADALLLIVVNPRTEEIKVIAVNRDTMTDIEIYDTAGMYLNKETAQITLQYAYGDGREKSCQLMEQTISELFYGIPIHGYGALDMQSIATINDAVGGVEVTVLEDMTKFKKEWTQGTTVHLTGEEALLYIARRDTGYLGSNIGRVERQKQYLTAYVSQLKNKMKQDVTFPVTLLGNIKKHMVTSLTVKEITYLADTLLGYEFNTDNIISIPGESKLGEKHEEFYADDAALKNIVIDVFYDKVEQREEVTVSQ
ncbi:MAG: LCP family protein [Lachnospiraceae bacterium]|nr:LCP family protein [Lachnospiraceae bacterium]